MNTLAKTKHMDWFYQLNDPILITIISSVLLFISIVLITKAIGLRSFAKFTAYDFAFTIAIGSIAASILTSSTSFFHGIVAISSLLAITYGASTLQQKYSLFDNFVSNKPLLLMKGTIFLEENMKYSRVNKSQLIAKLREANVTSLDQVLAVVLESTGDISVLHKSSSENDKELDDLLLDDVRESVK